MATTSAYSEGLAGGFTKEENELLTRVGSGTLMGDLFRQYWIPVLPVLHLEEPGGVDVPPASIARKKNYLEPGGKPKRIRLLGEDLVLFRTGRGELGLIGAYCPHRLAPLYFGRIENDGVRCPYHGWKFAPGGKCIDMPNVPKEYRFEDRIQHPGYPCVEYGGVIWTYMGPSKEPPGLPEFEFTVVPDDQRNFLLFHQESNYLQAVEGGIDPTHVMWLHSPYDLSDDKISRGHQPAQQILAASSGHRTPAVIEIADTAGGFMYGAGRPFGEGKSLWRVNQFIMPFYTMPPGGDWKQGRMFVPIDDENCVKWMFGWFPTRSLMDSTKEGVRTYMNEEVHLPATNEPYGFIRPKANKSNDYLMNWETHRTRRMGVPGVNLQDRCVAENEGPTPILDRTQENLCVGDMTIVKARRMLLQAARELREQGTVPSSVRNPDVYRVRGVSKAVPDSIPWVEGVKEEVTVL